MRCQKVQIGFVIKEQRLKLGLTLEQVGRATGVARATVQRWESGVIQSVGQDKIEKLAEILELSPTMLLELNERKGKSQTEKLPLPDYNREDAYSILVHDDAMAPLLQHGDLAWLIPLQSPPAKGEVVAVRFGLDVLIRYTYPHPEGYVLTASNPAFSPILLNTTDGTATIENLVTDRFELVGRAIFLQRRI